MPPVWLGEHATRRDEAVEQAQAKGLEQTLTKFAVALALLDDWNIEGLNGNPENWDFSKLDLQVISWVNNDVLEDFTKSLIVPKGLSTPLSVE